MQMRLACSAIVLTVMSTGCSGDSSSDGGSGGTTGAATSTTNGGDGQPPDTTGPATTSPATTGGAGSSTSAAGSGSTGLATGADSSSSGGACAPGTEGCPCDGDSCDAGLTCTAGTCVADAASCTDHPEGEPNDSEMTAVDLGEVPGCMVASIDGAIDAGDTDWFTYHGTHDPTCNQDTSALLDATPSLETCMYWECDQGNAQVVCFGTPVVFDDAMNPGCCAPNGSTVFMQRNCLGVGDQPDGTIYINVLEPSEPMCVEYSLAYLF